jgi:hypothetical protein
MKKENGESKKKKYIPVSTLAPPPAPLKYSDFVLGSKVRGLFFELFLP